MKWYVSFKNRCCVNFYILLFLFVGVYICIQCNAQIVQEGPRHLIITRINLYLTPGVAFGYSWKQAPLVFNVFWAFDQTHFRRNVTVLHTTKYFYDAAKLKAMIEVQLCGCYYVHVFC